MTVSLAEVDRTTVLGVDAHQSDERNADFLSIVLVVAGSGAVIAVVGVGAQRSASRPLVPSETQTERVHTVCKELEYGKSSECLVIRRRVRKRQRLVEIREGSAEPDAAAGYSRSDRSMGHSALQLAAMVPVMQGVQSSLQSCTARPLVANIIAVVLRA